MEDQLEPLPQNQPISIIINGIMFFLPIISVGIRQWYLTSNDWYRTVALINIVRSPSTQ